MLSPKTLSLSLCIYISLFCCLQRASARSCSKIVKAVKEKHPSVPLILYISGSGGLVEQMAATGADIVSLDWSVDMARGRQRMGSEVGVQGNLDPAVLFAPHDVIEEKVGCRSDDQRN